jgi:PQQ-dependent dehydrogenase (methanol/ethanol family)
VIDWLRSFVPIPVACLMLIAMQSGCARPTPPPAGRVEEKAADTPAPAAAVEAEDPTPARAVVRGVAEEQEQAADPDEPVGSIDDKDLLAAAGNNANWLMYGRTYDAHRHSPLTQINQKNVHRLVPVWTFQTGVLDGFECTPLVIDGIMYITTPWNHAYAIDCKTGAQLWHYQKSLPDNLALCCDAVNRGFAAWGDRLYMTTLDAHLVCLDRNTGEEIWDTEITIPGDDGQELKQIYKLAYSATVAPLVVKDKVIMGISGAEYGIRGFIDAYDAKSGKRVWRFWTVPSPDDKEEHAQRALKTWEGKTWLTGGGSAWVTGSYDPKLNTLYWGVGNPSPDFNGDLRKGDNLYTVSIVALNPDTGAYKWHFQASPHDVWDYDGVNEPLLVDIERDGQKVPALVQAHRNGYFYCLNRETGAFIYGKPFCEVTWTDRTKGVDGLDPKTGRPFINPAALPTEKGVRVCPGAAGGKEWNPMAYHPGTGLCYVPVINNCAKFTSGKAFHQGAALLGQLADAHRQPGLRRAQGAGREDRPAEVGGGHALADGDRRPDHRRRTGLHGRRRRLLHCLRC